MVLGVSNVKRKLGPLKETSLNIPKVEAPDLSLLLPYVLLVFTFQRLWDTYTQSSGVGLKWLTGCHIVGQFRMLFHDKGFYCDMVFESCIFNAYITYMFRLGMIQIQSSTCVFGTLFKHISGVHRPAAKTENQEFSLSSQDW